MPITENDIVQALSGRFPGLEPTIQRERRIWLEASRSEYLEVLVYLHGELGFPVLAMVTGLDTGEEFQLIYHVNTLDGMLVNIRVRAPYDDPVFDSVCDIYKGSVIYEAEARNLLGLTINGIPKQIRYPLPDGWPEGNYPLRKDWQPEGADSVDNEGSD